MSGWRAASEPSAIRSVSVWNVSTGHVDVGADEASGVGVGIDGLRRCDSGAPAATAAVDEEAVVDAGERVDGVDVGHQPERRLRLADGDDALRSSVAERRDAGVVRSACATCENMSYEKLSPGWTSGA